ncbi:unnamed protein product [Brassica oleracea var. botrytis]|uniref:Uncharacterized protein n=1 Tax=Brassica oleracea TaxID=3712 RepID=A0A3P6CP05_BRAOL|nr:unnamed protein product [Brassica oleracea]
MLLSPLKRRFTVASENDVALLLKREKYQTFIVLRYLCDCSVPLDL